MNKGQTAGSFVLSELVQFRIGRSNRKRLALRPNTSCVVIPPYTSGIPNHNRHHT